MRIFTRRERPHPGAQLTLFEAEDGWRYSLWVPNRPAATRGWLGQCAYIDAAHRVHTRVEEQGQPGVADRLHDRLHPAGPAQAVGVRADVQT